jgi:hypothetical protein
MIFFKVTGLLYLIKVSINIAKKLVVWKKEKKKRLVSGAASAAYLTFCFFCC